ncbi:MAG: hypothetical protein J5848_04130 [Bacteroidales bacterium]|nr:hypothetical protein [Bacteroidales bacterium]
MKRLAVLILLLAFVMVLSAQTMEPFMLKTYHEEGFRKPQGEQYQSLGIGIAYDITITLPVWDGQENAMEAVISTIRDSVMMYSLGFPYVEGDNYLAKAMDRYVQGNMNMYAGYDIMSYGEDVRDMFKWDIDISSHGHFVGKDFVQYTVRKELFFFDSTLREFVSFVFDANTGKQLRVKDFLKADKKTELAVVQMLRDSIEAQKKDIGHLDFIFPEDIYEYTNFDIKKDEIFFSFSSDGILSLPCIEVVISKQEMKKYIKRNCKLYSFWYGE